MATNQDNWFERNPKKIIFSDDSDFIDLEYLWPGEIFSL